MTENYTSNIILTDIQLVNDESSPPRKKAPALKFKDLPSEHKRSLLIKLPDNFTSDDFTWSINTRVSCRGGWKAYYDCKKKGCQASATLKVNDHGTNAPRLDVRTIHSCSETSAILLLDDKDAMTDMVKSMALDNPAMRAPKIAMEVWKHFEDKNTGELFS
jgi:tryptophanyl-tRNA synthetase